MGTFKPPPVECEICETLIQIYTVYRKETGSLFYVCDFHNHMQLSDCDTEIRHYYVEKHLYRCDNTLKYFDFEYKDMINYNKRHVFIRDRHEEKYHTTGTQYHKNIYVLGNGKMVRDYFEGGRWELADKTISGVYVWVKS